MMTDEGGHYFTLGDHFASHESVSHKADEYVRGDVHTNTIENFYSVFKRGMKGVYQHCSEKHLRRYLAEFDFRYSTDKTHASYKRLFLLIPCWESQRLIPKRSAGPRATKIEVVSLKALDHHRPNREEPKRDPSLRLTGMVARALAELVGVAQPGRAPCLMTTYISHILGFGPRSPSCSSL
jgi:hypothetical protein